MVGESVSWWRGGLPVVMLVLVGLAILVSVLLPSRPAAADGRLHIVCTFLPMYVFTQNVVGEVPGVDVQLLIERDVGCPHSYSLTGQDLKKISRADVIVANGLGIEPFLDAMLRGQSRAKVITIADACDVIRAGPSEGGHEENHDTERGHGEAGHGEHATTKPAANGSAATGAAETDEHAGHDHGHTESEMNPHTWVSPRQAMIEVRTLARKLGEIDAEHADQYRANGEAYSTRLQALADRMEAAARGFTKRNIVTGHPAFDYLARDLKLNVVATLSVVPGETGSASEMARIIDAIRKSGAAAVFQEPPFADKVAQTIARDAGVPVYPLNPLNSDAGLSKPGTLDDVRRL